jgi:hypothetical protein
MEGGTTLAAPGHVQGYATGHICCLVIIFEMLAWPACGQALLADTSWEMK